MRVCNDSKGETEPAEWDVCPRCKGHGLVLGDEGQCDLCQGEGALWVSAAGSGWTRAKGARRSKLY